MKKLVRDKIPEIIKSNGEECSYYIASSYEYNIELFKKLLEEALEVQKVKNKEELTEELADVMEVIKAICIKNGINEDDIEKVRFEKKEKKGGFDYKIILKKDD
ncbi:MAG: nucleoside triphosphate pyrophosphohydrolase [Candidatus Gracilibacteria bacterium]